MSRNRPDTASRSRSTTTLWLVFLLGIVTTSFGITFEAATGGGRASIISQVIAGVTLSAGSGVVGAAFSIIIASAAGRDAAEEIREMFTSSFQGRIISNDKDLDSLRRTWHQYFISEMDGKLFWSYSRCQFDKSAAINTIVVETTYRDSAGKGHAYRAELGVFGSRGVMISVRVNGSEQPSISVFPDLLEGYKAVHAGLEFKISWDGHPLVSKFLISQDKLIPGIAEGLVPVEFFAQLDSMWENEFTGQNKLVIADLSAGGGQA